MDLTSCDQLAYSEVRAAREAECHYSPQLCSWFKKQCARNTATRSTSVRLGVGVGLRPQHPHINK